VLASCARHSVARARTAPPSRLPCLAGSGHARLGPPTTSDRIPRKRALDMSARAHAAGTDVLMGTSGPSRGWSARGGAMTSKRTGAGAARGRAHGVAAHGLVRQRADQLPGVGSGGGRGGRVAGHAHEQVVRRVRQQRMQQAPAVHRAGLAQRPARAQASPCALRQRPVAGGLGRVSAAGASGVRRRCGQTPPACFGASTPTRAVARSFVVGLSLWPLAHRLHSGFSDDLVAG